MRPITPGEIRTISAHSMRSPQREVSASYLVPQSLASKPSYPKDRLVKRHLRPDINPASHDKPTRCCDRWGQEQRQHSTDHCTEDAVQVGRCTACVCYAVQGIRDLSCSTAVWHMSFWHCQARCQHVGVTYVKQHSLRYLTSHFPFW